MMRLALSSLFTTDHADSVTSKPTRISDKYNMLPRFSRRPHGNITTIQPTRKTHPAFRPTGIATFFVCILYVWSTTVYYMDSNIKLMANVGGLNLVNLGLDADLEASTSHAPSENPWYGWQPEIALEMECSWRDCFKPEHSCKTCRDRLEDMGDAPLPPEDWVPDVTMLRRMLLEGHDSNGRPWPPSLDKELLEDIGVSDDGRPRPPSLDKELLEDIGVSGETNDDNKKLLKESQIAAKPMVLSPDGKDGPTILCFVYTMEVNHATNIRAIRETWGSGCDGFLAFSTKSDPRIPAISIPHEGPEEYGNMWQKVRSMWQFVGQHYLEDFDYFFVGGEDLFLIPQNLRSYLKTLGSPEDLNFVGRRFKGARKNNYFNSGGPGYTLSRGVLRKLYSEGLSHPKCSPDVKTSKEDVMIAECLREAFGIGLTDTRDDQKRERFHPFSPATHLSWKPPERGKRDWYDDFNKDWGLLLGKDCCAPDSVSFHYIKNPAMARHLQAILYSPE